MSWMIALLIKPVVILALMVPVVALEVVIMRALPEGRLKRILGFRWRV